MPQLDTVTFFNQLFWFTLVFFSFYYITLGTVIPKLALVLKVRAKKLQQDMSSTATLKAETNSIVSSYDKKFMFMSNSLVGGINTSLDSRSYWLKTENNKTAFPEVTPFYTNLLIQLFFKTL